MKDHILAIDCGTQSVRILLFDTNGVVVAKVKETFDIYQQPKPNWYQFAPEQLWSLVCRALNQLWQNQDADPNRVLGLAVTAQRGTMVFVDNHGNSTYPAISWMDKRTTTTPPKLHFFRDQMFRLAGVKKKVDRLRHQAQATWLAENRPDAYSRTAHFLMVSGYLNYRLSGRFKDSYASQVGYLPFDYRNQTWCSESDWRWQACSISPKKVPELIGPNQPLGEVCLEASSATGLPLGTPIIASGADKATEILGCGVTSPSELHLSYGTTATVNRVHHHYHEPMRFLPAYPSADGSQFAAEFQLYRGYWLVSWFRDQFAHFEMSAARQDGRSAEAHLDELALQIAPGSEGLLVLPFWSPGLNFPDQFSSGSVLGLQDRHHRGHLYRALLEGIALGLKMGQMRCRGGIKNVEKIWLSGGGAQSIVARQITADVFNTPVAIPHTTEASGLGAAINVAVGMGVYPSIADAIEKMRHTETVVKPHSKSAALYQHVFKYAFTPAVNKLASINKALNRWSNSI